MKKTIFILLYVLFIGSLVTLLILPLPHEEEAKKPELQHTELLHKVSTTASIKLSPYTLSFPLSDKQLRLEPVSIPTVFTYHTSLLKAPIVKTKECKIVGPKESVYLKEKSDTLLLIWQKELDGKIQSDTTMLTLENNRSTINSNDFGSILEMQFCNEIEKLSEREIEKRNDIPQRCSIEKKSIHIPANIVTISPKEIRISFLDNTTIELELTHEIL